MFDTSMTLQKEAIAAKPENYISCQPSGGSSVNLNGSVVDAEYTLTDIVLSQES